MIELREILAADALTPSEVGTFADPASRWITVDAALLIIERLTDVQPTEREALAARLRARGYELVDHLDVPTTSSRLDSDSAPRTAGPASSRDEGRAASWRPEPLDAVTGVEGASSGVTSPTARCRPRPVAGVRSSPRPV